MPSLSDNASISAAFAILPRITRMVHAAISIPRSKTLSYVTDFPCTCAGTTFPRSGTVWTCSNTRCCACDMTSKKQGLARPPLDHVETYSPRESM